MFQSAPQQATYGFLSFGRNANFSQGKLNIMFPEAIELWPVPGLHKLAVNQ